MLVTQYLADFLPKPLTNQELKDFPKSFESLMEELGKGLTTTDSKNTIIVDEFWSLGTVVSAPPIKYRAPDERSQLKQVVIGADTRVLTLLSEEFEATTSSSVSWFLPQTDSHSSLVLYGEQSDSGILLFVIGPWTCEELQAHIEHTFPEVACSVTVAKP